MIAFPGIEKIDYEGPDSKNPLAFRHYNESEVVEGKSMKEHLRFSVAYWHTLRGTGADPFGPGTMLRPWEDKHDSVDNAIHRVRVAFEFIEKLGAPFYCFHDRDVAPEGRPGGDQPQPRRGRRRTSRKSMQRTGIKLLWGTANLFSNPRYMHGAATSPNADAFAFAAAQVKKALEVTKELGGAGLRVLGRPRGLPDPAQHRHEARARPPRPVPAHGGRLCQGDRLYRPVLLRAEAQGADQAPVRLRLPRPASTSSAPTAWPTTSS